VIQGAYGHPKDRRVDLKQIQAGLGISADGAVQLLATAITGQTGEITQVVSAICTSSTCWRSTWPDQREPDRTSLNPVTCGG
jgi:hypothetical protein